jgi:hypothetical protein
MANKALSRIIIVGHSLEKVYNYGDGSAKNPISESAFGVSSWSQERTNDVAPIKRYAYSRLLKHSATQRFDLYKKLCIISEQCGSFILLRGGATEGDVRRRFGVFVVPLAAWVLSKGNPRA